MRHQPDNAELLLGPYHAPPLKIGDRATCHLRDRQVVIIGISSDPLPWPRCQSIGQRGGSGLLLAGDLVRAVKQESVAAIGYWWGVSEGVVCRWRKALGISRAGTEGSRRLILAAAQKGTAAMKAREWTEAEREEYRQRANRLNLGRNLQPGYHGQWWTTTELELLGTLPDDVPAEQTGRTVNAVRIKRVRRGITRCY